MAGASTKYARTAARTVLAICACPSDAAACGCRSASWISPASWSADSGRKTDV